MIVFLYFESKGARVLPSCFKDILQSKRKDLDFRMKRDSLQPHAG